MPERIFQVLRNDDSRDVICSYPTGGYEPQDLRQLAVGLSMAPHGNQPGEAKTNCTRRLECLRPMVDRAHGGGLKQVGSLYIPHGKQMQSKLLNTSPDSVLLRPRHFCLS